MDRKSRAEKLQRLRKNQGLTQEALAEKASINLRTLQRIEQGETEPRGHTLRQLALALSQTPEEMTQLYVQQETPKPDLQADATSLQLLNLSALAFWVVPFGNLLIPFVLWRLNRDKVTGVRELGGRLSRFQFVWSCLAYGLLLTTIGCAIVHPVGMNPLVPFDLLIGVGVLCLLNSGLILMASFQIKKGHRAFYMKTPVIFRRPITTCLGFLILWTSLVGNTLAQGYDSTKSPPPPGQLIDVGGWKLHLHGQGSPTLQGPSIILEAGIGDFSFDWSLVQPTAAAFARVYSYDRAGSAWSELGPRPHTMHQIVYALHTLLQRAQVPGPYVLVGASYGGVLVRLFAQQHPEDVAGMVLVDSGLENSLKYIDGKPVCAAEVANEPVPPVKKVATQADNQLAQTPEARKILDEAFAKVGLSLTRPQLNPAYQKLPEFARNLRLWATSQYEYYAANDNGYDIFELAGMLRYQQAHPQFLGSIPLIVLTRGQSDEPASNPKEQERKQAQTALQNFSSNSKQLIAEQSGHHIQIDQPDLVVEAIREVVESVRTQKPLVQK